MSNYTNTTSVNLNLSQIEYLRSVIYEYYQHHFYQCSEEIDLHQQIEQILGNASNQLFSQE